MLSTKEIAEKLVTHCNDGNYAEAIKDLYADDVTSYEAPGVPVEARFFYDM